DFVKKVLKQKLYREIDIRDSTYFISYFTEDNKYFPYRRVNDIETVLDTLDSIKYFSRDLNNVFIFKDKYSFNIYIQPEFENDIVIKRNISYNNDENFICSNIYV